MISTHSIQNPDLSTLIQWVEAVETNADQTAVEMSATWPRLRKFFNKINSPPQIPEVARVVQLIDDMIQQGDWTDPQLAESARKAKNALQDLTTSELKRAHHSPTATMSSLDSKPLNR